VQTIMLKLRRTVVVYLKETTCLKRNEQMVEAIKRSFPKIVLAEKDN
jgi:hypothetical protein